MSFIRNYKHLISTLDLQNKDTSALRGMYVETIREINKRQYEVQTSNNS